MSVMETLNTRRTYRRFAQKTGAAGCGGRYGGGPAPVVLRRETVRP